MNRIVLGAVAALLLVSAGLFWWQGRAETEAGAPPPSIAAAPVDPDALPSADPLGMVGPALPEASEATREQRRFDRVDRDRDSRVTRNEMLAPRADAFRKLDVDHNNLLTFEEWAVRTSDRFKTADTNGDAILDRAEFATTKSKRVLPKCNCTPPRQRSAKGRAAEAPLPPEDLDEGDDPAG